MKTLDLVKICIDEIASTNFCQPAKNKASISRSQHVEKDVLLTVPKRLSEYKRAHFLHLFPQNQQSGYKVDTYMKRRYEVKTLKKT